MSMPANEIEDEGKSMNPEKVIEMLLARFLDALMGKHADELTDAQRFVVRAAFVSGAAAVLDVLDQVERVSALGDVLDDFRAAAKGMLGRMGGTLTRDEPLTLRNDDDPGEGPPGVVV